MVRTEVEKVARIEGGWVAVPMAELLHAWRACRSKPLGIADFRAWLACHEMVARRCHVHRDRDRSPLFDFPELAKLLDVRERRARASIQRLEAAGLLRFTAEAITFPEPTSKNEAEVDKPFDTIGLGRGSVAIPRRMLRRLLDGARPALIATVLGLAMRCLSRRKGGWGSRGRAKASWIARTFSLSDRQIKTARAELVALGWIAAEDSGQWAMNRWGRAYRIDLGWIASATAGGRVTAPKSSHPPADSGPVSSHPDSDPEPLRERIQNQEPGPEPAGARFEGKGIEDKPLAAPTLNDVQVADLKDFGRLLQLHDQAVAKGLITTAEADRLRVVASAEHALAVGKSNPAGLFAWLVRNRAWRYLTGEDEDRANGRIKTFLRGPEPSRGSVQPSPVLSSRGIEPGLSEDARLVREIRAAMIRAGIFRDPWPAFVARYPEWTRARWDRALGGLGLLG